MLSISKVPTSKCRHAPLISITYITNLLVYHIKPAAGGAGLSGGVKMNLTFFNVFTVTNLEVYNMYVHM
jgi:hypothetical protein